MRAFSWLPRLVVVFAAAAVLRPSHLSAQAIIRAGESTYVRIGILVQGWADWQQASDASGTVLTGTQQNLFLRRTRMLLPGQLTKDLYFYFQIDSGNIGKNKPPGALNPTVTFTDAFLLWKLSPEFQLQTGLFYVPTSRNALTGSRSYLTLDTGPTSFLEAAPTESNTGGRDTGIGVQGYVFGGRLQYRTGVYQGQRSTGSQNAFRYAGRLQYEFFDQDSTILDLGYVYPGTNLGKKKIVAVGVSSDNQGDYHSYNADVFADIPVGRGDAATSSLNWIHYDGETRFPTLPRQNDYLFEAGYFISSIQLQPFLQYHRQSFSDAAFQVNDSRRYQVGFNYYVIGQTLKVTPAFTRLIPDLGSKVATNEYTLQLQFAYF